MPPSGAHTLYLHIGRGKSGSSTIQSLARDHAEFMEAQGISCPLTLNGMPNHARLAAALCDPEHDAPTLRRLRKDLQRSKHGKVFVSGEALFSITRDGMTRLKRLLDDREIRILAYVRDYPGWLQSVYAQRTKRATSSQNFDAYFKSVRKAVSAWPRLERWASVFGWEAIRVRPLDPSALVGGNLISDVLDALGVSASAPDVPSLNVSPHWITLELQRSLAAAAAASSIGRIDPKSARGTRNLFESCSAGVEPKRVQYLTRAQWRMLAHRYMRDVAAFGERMGRWFPVRLEEPEERPFLPSFMTIPDAVKSDILARLGETDVTELVRPEVLALLERLLKEEEEETAADTIRFTPELAYAEEPLEEEEAREAPSAGNPTEGSSVVSPF